MANICCVYFLKLFFNITPFQVARIGSVVVVVIFFYLDFESTHTHNCDRPKVKKRNQFRTLCYVAYFLRNLNKLSKQSRRERKDRMKKKPHVVCVSTYACKERSKKKHTHTHKRQSDERTKTEQLYCMYFKPKRHLN